MSNFPDTKQNRIVWHYTVGEPHYRGILSSRVIKTSSAWIAQGERPAVWFTQDSTWERTASQGPYWEMKGPVESILVRIVGDGVPLLRIGVLDTTAAIDISTLQNPFNCKNLSQHIAGPVIPPLRLTTYGTQGSALC